MALLIAVWALALVPLPASSAAPPRVLEILFDAGAPERSVAIAGRAILHTGSFYRHYQITAFEPGALVLRDRATEEPVKWLARPGARENIRRKALHVFAVKQLKAIHAAQIDFLRTRQEDYAPDLHTLIRDGSLDRGFESGKKLGYTFRVAKIGRRKGHYPEAEEVPVYRVTAEPETPGMLFFSVDEQGDVRYANKPELAAWGPVWDYNEPAARGPKHYFIGVG